MEEIIQPTPPSQEIAPVKVKPKEHTGYPHHKPGGRGFAKGHKKLGGKKKGFKHFKTLFQEEMENTVLDKASGRTVRNDIAIVKKTTELAREGNLTATQLIIERMDGKVPQVLQGDEDNPLTIIIESEIAAKYNQEK